MAEQVLFNVGKDYILNNVLVSTPATWALSAKAAPVNPLSPQAGEWSAADTISGLSEIIPWSGVDAYGRNTITIPGSSNGVITFPATTWITGAAVDGPANVKTIVLIIGSTLIFAQNLKPAGVACPMDTANTALSPTVVFFLQNPGGT